jgi:hypothetical protein
MIDLSQIDIFDNIVEHLSPKEEDELIKIIRERQKKTKIPSPPCQCYMCDNWVDETDLYYIINTAYDRQIVCIECARDIYKMQDE